ncbi:MAG: domain nuclease, a component of toxin-antitoxin system [Gammaproteobacteria bacterium]|jgi:PIN domain nuclease of toxin-antitoxin system|nr:domain nuclease, a component of toxin-antitoxin system [Gammaproteobacteria bacterium]
MIYIDTHIAVFLYQGDLSLFSKKAIKILEQETPIISGMAELELQYLYEIKKLTVSPRVLMRSLENDLGLERCQHICADIAKTAQTITWTRDPFDRMIVANAELAKMRLLTKDQLILKHFKHAVW